MGDTRHSHDTYPYQRTRTCFTMSGEMDRQQGTASEAAGPAAAPAKGIAEEAEVTVPCLHPSLRSW